MEFTKEDIKFFIKEQWRKLRKFIKKHPMIKAVSKTVGFGALAAVIFWLLLMLFGFRYVALDFGDGLEARYLGFVWNNSPIAGKMIFSDGVTAEISDGGKKIARSDGYIYVGETQNWQYNGYGELSNQGGTSYKGEFLNGKMHGKGTYTDLDGGTYTGEFFEGKIHGKGIYRYSDGSVYRGEFAGGERHGSGIMSYPNGDVYFGEFAAGTRSGHGTYIWKNGLSYEGKFSNNLPTEELPPAVG